MCYTDLDLLVSKLGGSIYTVDMVELFPGCPNPREDVLATILYNKDNKPIFYINNLIRNKKRVRLCVAMLLSAIKLKKTIDNKFFILFSNDDFLLNKELNNNDEIITLATEIVIPTSLFIELSYLYNDRELAEIFFVDIKWIKLKYKLISE
ncbi:hypothetical protein [Clostridium disporicum]|uniref:hypothetical protein n=1 Tax=Clostridium disporicum TaxID=84024 RepID=UPI0034A2DB47